MKMLPMCLAVEVLGVEPSYCPGPDPAISAAIGRSGCLDCLAVCVPRLLHSMREASRLLVANEELSIAVGIDELTKVANRRIFEQQISEKIANEEPFVLFMIDIIKFKAVNDRLGHLGGDFVLRQTASSIESSVRGTDSVVCRYGGDEFAILLDARHRENTDLMTPEEADEIKERIIAEYLGLTDVQAYNTSYDTDQLGLKIGIAFWSPGMSREDLIGSADIKGPDS